MKLSELIEKYGDDKVKNFTTEKKPSWILKQMTRKSLLQKASEFEIFHTRGMLSVFLIQGFISHASYSRFDRLLTKARIKELKLNISKDN